MKKHELISVRRRAYGLTQAELGERVRVTGSTISQIESGCDASFAVVAAVEQTLKDVFFAMDEEEQRKAKIMELAMCINESDSDADIATTLKYMTIEIGRLAVHYDKKGRGKI